jgi:hypothetical protein
VKKHEAYTKSVRIKIWFFLVFRSMQVIRFYIFSISIWYKLAMNCRFILRLIWCLFFFSRFRLLRIVSGVYLVWYMSYIEGFKWCLSCMLDLFIILVFFKYICHLHMKFRIQYVLIQCAMSNFHVIIVYFHFVCSYV